VSIVSNKRETDSQSEAHAKSWVKLGDFTTTIRVLPISALALVSLNDLLKARARHLEEERRRERTLKLRFLLPGGRVTEEPQTPATR
jgi:hypothetical protein